MRSELRAFDLIYRLGGEEFAILLPGADLEKTREIAERLRAAVARSDTGGVSVTMSFGAGAISGSDVRLAQLYAQADAALYEAKRAGGTGRLPPCWRAERQLRLGRRWGPSAPRLRRRSCQRSLTSFGS